MHARLSALAARLEAYTGEYNQGTWENCAASVYANEMTTEVNHPPHPFVNAEKSPRTARVIAVFGHCPLEGAAEYFGVSAEDSVRMFDAHRRTAQEAAAVIREVASGYEEQPQLLAA